MPWKLNATRRANLRQRVAGVKDVIEAIRTAAPIKALVKHTAPVLHGPRLMRQMKDAHALEGVAGRDAGRAQNCAELGTGRAFALCSLCAELGTGLALVVLLLCILFCAELGTGLALVVLLLCILFCAELGTGLALVVAVLLLFALSFVPSSGRAWPWSLRCFFFVAPFSTCFNVLVSLVLI